MGPEAPIPNRSKEGPMKFAALAVALVCTSLFAAPEPAPVRPKAGKVEIFKLADIRPGMKGVAWTVLAGNTPEAIPVEILGLLKNQWGPKQDIILGKLGGKAIRTNVAGGMSGSPVYIDGKLVGAVALRFSVFSPDAICGITPIELMLEVNGFDNSRPVDAKTPQTLGTKAAAFSQTMIPIETPLYLSGFNENVIREFAPIFEQMGVQVAAGGASSSMQDAKPAPGWQKSLQPG